MGIKDESCFGIYNTTSSKQAREDYIHCVDHKR